FLHLAPRPTASTPFPYTTLFRSRGDRARAVAGVQIVENRIESVPVDGAVRSRVSDKVTRRVSDSLDRLVERQLELLDAFADEVRSEEHTSELQSRENLVCRRLLE